LSLVTLELPRTLVKGEEEPHLPSLGPKLPMSPNLKGLEFWVILDDPNSEISQVLRDREHLLA